MGEVDGCHEGGEAQKPFGQLAVALAAVGHCVLRACACVHPCAASAACIFEYTDRVVCGVLRVASPARQATIDMLPRARLRPPPQPPLLTFKFQQGASRCTPAERLSSSCWLEALTEIKSEQRDLAIVQQRERERGGCATIDTINM